MTEEDSNAMMNDCYEGLAKWHNEIARSNKRLLRAIKSVKGDTFYRNIKKALKELTEGCYHIEEMKYEIVRKTSGLWQNHSFGKEIKGRWTEQWSEGTEGDSWGGYIYIEIKKGRFLKVNFSM